ncbi:TPA: O-antigen polymerase [Vibrio cholerae]
MTISLINYIFIVFFIFFSLAVKLNYEPSFYVVSLLSWITIFINTIVIFRESNRIINPLSCFFISTLVFILSRPLLSLFIDGDIISVGNSITNANVVFTLCFVMITILFIINFSKSLRVPSFYILHSMPDFKYYNVGIARCSVFFACAFSLFFLYCSYGNYIILKGGISYFDFIDNINTEYFKYFFISKYFLIVYMILSKNNKSFLVSSFILFLASLGFILIGLRGYTIAYCFLFLIVFDMYYRITLKGLIFLAMLLVFISSYALSFRLGYNVFEGDNPLTIIIKTLFQQGASFEVVFGATSFSEDIKKCINYVDYLGGEDFGHCVDVSRGVVFEQGGFASSFFAELFYFLPFSPFIILLFSFFLALVQSCHGLYKDTNFSCKKSMLMIFFLTPNLVYFARSSVFDFIEKSFQSIIFLFFIFYCLKLVRKGGLA